VGAAGFAAFVLAAADSVAALAVTELAELATHTTNVAIHFFIVFNPCITAVSKSVSLGDMTCAIEVGCTH
jgi:hypothetical protein